MKPENTPPIPEPTNYNYIAGDYQEYAKDAVTSNEIGYGAVLALLGNVQGQKVLDYGCGSGRFSRIMKDRGAEVVGMDKSRKEIDLARANNPDISFMDIESVAPDMQGNFDTAVLNFVTCTIPDASEIKAILKRLRLLLKNGGRIILLNPNFDGDGHDYISEEWQPFSISEGAEVPVLLGQDRKLKVKDFYYSRKFYLRALEEVGFQFEALEQPLAKGTTHPWKDETKYPPYFVISARKVSE